MSSNPPSRVFSEPLESRRLLAVTAVVTAGRLTVTGTPATDVIYFEPTDGNGVRVFDDYPAPDATPIGTFDGDTLKAVVVDVKGGNDRVEISAAVRLFKAGTTEPLPVSIYGNAGNDLMFDYRGAKNTLIDGGLGPDILSGGGTLVGGAGNDTLYGFTGTAFAPGTASELLVGGGDNDTVVGYGGVDTIRTGAGNDTVYTRASAIAGVTNVCVVDTGVGRDTVDAGEDGTYTLGDDDDRFVVGDTSVFESTPVTNVAVDCGAGNDRIDASTSKTVRVDAAGGSGRDILIGGPNADTLRGGGGDDLIDGGRAGDRLFGDSGNDTLLGRAGDDVIYGDTDPLGGGDTPAPAAVPDGRDVLDGGIGDDQLSGQGGDDQLFGSDGRDTLTGGPGSDRLHGQRGVDRIEAAGDGTRDYLYDIAFLDDIVSVDADDVFV